MKRFLLLGCLGVMVAAFGAKAGSPAPTGATNTWENWGLITDPAQIQQNELNFVNYGTIATIFGQLDLFETYDTLNFTNYGTIVGQETGWRFGHTSSGDGTRGMAANFVNFNSGTVAAIDTPVVGNIGVNSACLVAPLLAGEMVILATNVITGAGSPGGGASLLVGADGRIDITGHHVDLSYSGLEVMPMGSQGGLAYFNNPVTQYSPDFGIHDKYWVQSSFNNNLTLNPGGLWTGGNAFAPPIPGPPNGPARPGPTPPLSLINPYADWWVFADVLNITVTNSSGDPEDAILLSNITKVAVFISYPGSSNVQAQVIGSPERNNPYQEIDVMMTSSFTNVATGLIEPVTLSVQDTLGSLQTRNRGILGNVLCPVNTSSPYNYVVLRTPLFGNFELAYFPPPAGFFVDSGQVDFHILYDSITNYAVNAGDFAGYGCFVDNVPSRPLSVAGATVNNLPGRINVTADTLDLTETRIRSEGFASMNTAHLISSEHALIDCENLSYGLASTNGNLKVENLVPASGTVARLRGNMNLWSAIWQNDATVIIENYATSNEVTTVPDPTGGTNDISTTNVIIYRSDITNNFTVNYQALMVDASQVATAVPVYVFDLAMNSTNIAVNDNMSVVHSLSIGGRSFTLNGGITIPGFYPVNPFTQISPPVNPLQNWVNSNAPNVLYFTNNGVLSVYNQARFGDDRPPYATFINRGSLSAASLRLRSDYVENSGSMTASDGLGGQGALFAQGTSGKFEGGSSSSGNLSQFYFNDLKLNNYQLVAGGKLTLSVTNSLADSGAGSGNVIQLLDGFQQTIKPLKGDLLGTTIRSQLPAVPLAQIFHVWAADDRGATPAGYSDNSAIGTLALSANGSPSTRFVFMGAGAQNAMYVDLLDLSSMTNFLSQLVISPNLVIYFAAAKLSTNTALPALTEPEEYLDGKFGGHLRWVQNFAGPNSSQDVQINGQRYTVNRALLNSHLINSDGQNSYNYDDFYRDGISPFVLVTPAVQVSGNGTVTPNLGGQPLIQGSMYSMTATPADGSAFTGWTGSANTSSPRLNFIVTNGLSFTANFTSALTPGSYSGLFVEPEPNGVEWQRSGAITVTTTKNSKYSCSLQIGKSRYSFSGLLDSNGAATFTPKNSPLVVALQVGTEQLTGTVGDGSTWTANIQGYRSVFNSKTNQALFAGTYTMVFPGSGDPANSAMPPGDGYGTVTVDKVGKVKLSGSLPDGTKLSQSATASRDGWWPLYVPLYSGAGQLLSWQSFAPTAIQDLGGQFNWIKQPNSKVIKYYPGGFSIETNAVGSRFSSSINPLPGFSSGLITLSGGNLSADIVNAISIGADNKVSVSGTNQLTLTLSSKGLFKGSVKNPATGKKFSFNGVMLQKQWFGSGYFLGTNEGGKVAFGP